MLVVVVLIVPVRDVVAGGHPHFVVFGDVVQGGVQVGLAPGGGLVRLDNVVKIERTATASRIDRTDRQREVRLRAGIAALA